VSTLSWGGSFRRALKRRTRNNPALQDRLFGALTLLAEDPFHPALKAHKLSGQLQHLWACWVEYDCRIIYAFEPDPATGEEIIVLIDLGSHDEVY
jgi:addiction module RelE/StbE family toxin